MLVVLMSVLAVLAGFTPVALTVASAAVVESAAPAAAAAPSASAVPSESLGYWLVARDGGIFSGGDATFHGSTGAVHLNRPIVGIGATPSGNGYWMVASDGGIFAFGDASFHGSTGAIHLNRPIVGIAPTPSGNGYWLVASDGGIFAFGDAAFHGSTGAIHLNRPIVGIASTPTGNGYWMVASDGGIFAFGDAAFHGSTGGIHLNRAIVGMSTTPTGDGYDLVASDGGIFSFGDATFHGSTGALKLNQPIVGMAATASGDGYWFVAADGGVFSFGDAGFFGSAGAMGLSASIVGMVATAPVPVVPPVAPATKLAFTTQPSSSTGGLPFATQPVVKVQNAAGGTVTGNSSTVTLAITTPAGATLDCSDNSKTAVAGVATFSGCNIDRAGTYTLTATATGLTQAVSASLTVTVGAAAKLQFTTQPSGAVLSVPFGTQPAVSVLDAGGNVVTGNTSSVTLSIPAGAPTLACTGTTTKAAVAGVATFAGCNISAAGTYTITATDGALTTASSASVEITTAAAKLAFTTAPSATAGGGSPFATQPVVTVQDATGHTIVANTSSVVLTLTSAGAATLACTGSTTKAAVAGVAAFAGCNIDKPGTYTLTATDGALTTAVSSNVVVSVGPAAKLAFTTQPVGAASTVALATQPAVTVQDLGGNTIVGNTSSVTLSITTPAGAILAGCTANPKAAVAGVATFVGCNIDKAGPYTLTAVDGALTSATSSVLTIAVGAATKLGFTTQPVGGPATGPFATQPVVAVQDAGGNTVVGDSSSVTLTITSPAGALLCTANPQGAVAGVATFAGCHIDVNGTYTLTAAATGLTSVVSSPLTVAVGVASQLAFTTQPSGASGGSAFGTQPSVAVQDAVGNTVTTNTSNVVLTITTPAGATLVCAPATTKAAVLGVATFVGCNINLAGTYTLTATAGALATAVSSSVIITTGAGTQLGFTTQPVGSSGGTNFGTQPVVAILDAGGNVVTSNVTNVTLAITTPNGATIGCTANPKTAVSGVAAFAACTIDKAGTYTLTATDPGLTPAISSSLTITVGVATHLAFTTQPSGAVSSTAFATQPVVTVRDAGNNTVTTDVSTVVLTLTTPGTATLACTGTTSKAAAAGVATFAGCNVDIAGSYTLTATDGSLTTATSSSLTITAGAAAKLAFTTQPVGATGGLPFATQPVVTVQDAAGNTVTTNTSVVNLTIPAGSTLTCTSNAVAAVAGAASFALCNIDHTGVYTMTATGTGLTSATSSPVNITVGVAAKLAFTTQPGNATGGLSLTTAPVVAVQDAGGNTVGTDTSGVTVALTIPNGATLACTGTTTHAAAAGVATFAACSVDLPGTYTLTASDGALATAQSASLTITVGPAAKLAFTTQPSSSAVSLANFASQPIVKVQDAGGNTVTTNSSAVTLTITSSPVGTVLACNTNTQGAVAGVATFAGCDIDDAGTYTLTATDGALTAATSSSLTITFGAAAKVAFTTQPVGSTGGAAFATQPIVTVQDASGNTVTNNTSNVLLTITGAPAGAVLTCTNTTVAAAAGVATFALCNIDDAATYTLTAADTGLTSAVSNSLTVTVGAASKLAFTTQPGNSTGGVAFAPQPVVTVQDLGGNTVSNSSTVTLAITSPGAETFTCAPQGAVAGVATFTGCNIDRIGTYTLTATDGSLTPAVSTPSLTITVGAAVKLGFSIAPIGAQAGVVFAQQPAVAIQDAGGNTVTGNTTAVTLTIETGPAAVLTCTPNPQSPVAGVATFSACSINNAGTYTLTASGLNLTSVTSGNVIITA